MLFCDLSRLACSPISCRTSAVVASDENGDDGEEVVSELTLVAGAAVVTLVLNHDLTPGTLENVLDELKGEAAEPVPVGYHNLLDISTHRPVQNGEEAWALPVDARGDVADDLVLWVRFLEGGDLSLEVVPLRRAGDPRVADPGLVAARAGDSLPRSFGPRMVSAEEALNVGLLVEALAVAAEADDGNLARVGPAAECGRGNTEGGPDSRPSDVFVGGRHIVHKQLSLFVWQPSVVAVFVCPGGFK